MLQQIVTILIPPNLVHTHGELVVSMSFHCQKMRLLLRCQSVSSRFFLKFVRAIVDEDFKEFFWLDLAETHVCHVHSFVVRVSCQLILLILVVQVSYVVVADTCCLIVLTIEKDTGLG